MAGVQETVEYVTEAGNWDERVNRIRQVPGRHGTDEHAGIYADIARRLYVGHLAPDFAYIHGAPFFELPHFLAAYDRVVTATDFFTQVSVAELAAAIRAEPTVLLPLRTVCGLTKGEFADSTLLVAEPLGLAGISDGKVDSIERRGTAVSAQQAEILAHTVDRIMNRTLFADAKHDLRLKQDKPDTVDGWATVQRFAAEGVPYATFLNQRHYGGAFRQVLDGTSTQRGNLIEDAVEDLFKTNGIPYLRTGSHNQRDIAERFGITVTPAPDFVTFDQSDTVRAMLECKGANDGGTARDKALRFKTLRSESIRLSGLPLLGVLGGMGWTRVNDTLGPVVRDCDGRVFTLSNLTEMLSVYPFPTLTGLA